MDDSILTDGERRFLAELEERGIRYLIVGMSAALLQGARGATEDIHLWFEDLSDPEIGEAVRSAGGIWISGSFGSETRTRLNRSTSTQYRHSIDSHSMSWGDSPP